ncbi:MAG TPA: PAS domain S-box protein, partial [Spirochaetota bacterium]|nr:PAS domain S-box protein [Spirochaetota bacterium]
ASERITEIFGLPGDLESIFPTFISRLCQEDKERFLNSIREAQEKIAPWNFEGRLLKPSGEIMWFKGLSTPVRSDDRVVFDGIFLDITEQKLAEEKSRQSEEKFTKVFMTTPDCIVITRLKDGQIMDVNRGFEEISGWKTHEVIGRTAMEINVWNDLVERDKMVNDLKADLDVLNRESRFRRKDGSLRNVNYSARRIKIAGDDCIIFVLQDITNLKEAERSLRSSLDEKELLIKELYHRTKNNMQVISGLLKLKSAGTDDQEIHDLFTDIETRIQTMALVHQKLYESQNLTDLNLHDFINSFAELITRNYALIPEKISIRQSVDSIPISIDVAMPLSLVLNELISNSLKHAFHGESHGEILIKIESAGKNLKFEYRDNGIGLPEGFEPSVSATLGMNIIHTISKNQLGGEIIFLKGKGFGCIINIKTNLYRRRI